MFCSLFSSLYFVPHFYVTLVLLCQFLSYVFYIISPCYILLHWFCIITSFTSFLFSVLCLFLLHLVRLVTSCFVFMFCVMLHIVLSYCVFYVVCIVITSSFVAFLSLYLVMFSSLYHITFYIIIVVFVFLRLLHHFCLVRSGWNHSWWWEGDVQWGKMK